MLSKGGREQQQAASMKQRSPGLGLAHPPERIQENTTHENTILENINIQESPYSVRIITIEAIANKMMFDDEVPDSETRGTIAETCETIWYWREPDVNLSICAEIVPYIDR